MSEMSDLLFRDIGELFDGPHATPKRIDEGPYFLNISSLDAGRLYLSQSDHVSDEEFKKWTRRVTPQEDDLLFSYETRLGEAALMPGGVAACLGRRMALLRPDRERIVPRFLLYYYLSPHFQDLIQQRQIQGATVPRIGLATMGEWPISIPSLENQRAISDVLGALDDKIAANERSADLCGQFSRALYQRLLSGPTERIILSDLFEHKPGRYLSKESYDSNGNHWIYGSNSIMGRSIRPLIEEPFVVLAKIGTYCGNLRWSQRPAWVNNNASALIPKVREYGRLAAEALSSIDMTPFKAGTGQPYIKISELMSAGVDIPKLTNQKSEPELMNDLAEVACRCSEENYQLARTRDELLPLLMSGKIAVKDAEKMASDVV